MKNTILSKEEQHNVFLDIQTCLDEKHKIVPEHKFRYEKLRNTIINANIQLVESIAAKYYSRAIYRSLSISELTSAGIMGMITAIRKFDLSRNVAFSTYCTTWIKQAIQSETNKSTVHIPARVRALSKKVSKKCSQDNISIDEVCTLFNISNADKERIKCVLLQPVVSTDNQFDYPVEDTHNEIIKTEEYKTLEKALNKIDSRSKEIILARMEGTTLQECGHKLGITKERTRQLESAAIKELKELVGNK